MWVGSNVLLDDILKDETEYPKTCRIGHQEKQRECEAGAQPCCHAGGGR